MQLKLTLLTLAVTAPAAATSSRPNFVFILTDDQDSHMHSLDYMPLTKMYLVNEGTTFDRHYCTIAVCCPSRANLLTGQMSHNTNVTDVVPPHGGYPKWVSQGYTDKHLAYWMQEAGYNTYYSGKLFNHHTTDNYNSPAVQGFTGSDFILDPFTYQYFNVSMTRNGELPVNYAGQYTTDVTADKAYGFVDDATADKDTPFFLMVAPVAPHSDVTLYPVMDAGPPGVAERHRHLFKDYKIPRTDNFNPDTPSGVSWVATLDRLNDTVLEYNDEYQRQRLRALQAVDEMVEGIVLRLDAAGVLDDTYIFYSTDNGYHISQHRLMPGKMCGFETDIRIPMIVRGPGVAAGHLEDAVSSHTDIAPTILSLAGIPLRDTFDGVPMPLHDEGEARHEHLGLEFWGIGIPEGKYGFRGRYMDAPSGNAYPNNTYKGLRIESAAISLYYSVWCTGERELYNMKVDPGQMHNLFGKSHQIQAATTIMGHKMHKVVARLDALTMVLKSCTADTCRYPWRSIHPQGDVNSLNEALDSKFDELYNKQPKVSYSKCELGYIKESEGPMDVLALEGPAQENGDMYHNKEQQPIVIDPDWSLWV